MKIVPNQTFLDQGNRYEEGQEYEVDEALGRYFLENSWIEPAKPLVGTEAVTLDVQSTSHGQKVRIIDG